MKLTTKLQLTLALAAGIFTSSAIAGPGPQNWPPAFPTRVKTMSHAMKCCQPKEKVALACKDCKTVNEKSGEDKSAILGWFKADSKHNCDGCGGKIDVTTYGGGKGQSYSYKHICSKCGPDSAFTCSTHKG